MRFLNALGQVELLNASRRWRYIVRYDLPPYGSIRWRATLGDGHHTIWATRAELESYLAPDYCVRL